MNDSKQSRQVRAAITRLRAEIEALPMDKGGKRQGIAPELKQKIVDTMLESGQSIEDFSPLVAVSFSALRNWTLQLSGDRRKSRKVRKKALSGKSGFKKMLITEDTGASGAGRFTLEGPMGLKLTGLGMDDVAILWRSLC